MYLIPLNLDDPFKKVFDSPHIAQAFIEDMLGVKITSIEKLEKDHKITNAAALVRFDYRCKINEKYVIIEMQQGYKIDVVKRFYLYHCLDTALQLETIKETIVKDIKGREHRTRNYSELEPVITIIWMAQDNFDLEADSIEYNLYPKAFADFLRDDYLWQSPKSVLEEHRATLFKHPQRDRRELSFLEKNRLIFVFQSNVVKNKGSAPYVKWFEFAEKTRNPKNKAADFDEYTHNSIFAQMIHRLSISHADNQALMKEMGEEAYLAAKKLGEEVQKKEEEQLFYWNVYDDVRAQYGSEYEAQIKAERALRYAAIDQTEMALYEKKVLEKVLEQERLLAAEQAKKAAEQAKKAAEQTKKAEEQALETQKLLEKEKQERIIAKKLLQEEQKRIKKLEKEQKKLLEQERKRNQLEFEKKQIELVKNMITAGLSIDIVANYLGMSVSQIQDWQKLKK